MLDTMKMIKDNGLFPNKALGQNFLIDHEALIRIARSVNPEGSSVLEIGAGLGALTFELSERSSQVIAFEIDRRLFEVLNNSLPAHSNIRVIHADFLRYPPDQLCSLFDNKPFYVAANLPYYITTPICLRLIENELPICGMTLMMQEEAAGRFFAEPSDKNYGPLSILARLSYDISTVLALGPDAYYPKPEVSSVVLCFKRNTFVPAKCLPRIVHAAFSMRRKTLHNNLAVLFGKKRAQELIARSGFAADIRAENLPPEAFERLANSAEEYIN